MALELNNVKNAYDKYVNKKANRILTLGYLEACLVNFNVISNTCKDLTDYHGKHMIQVCAKAKHK